MSGWDNMSRLRLKLTNDYELSMIQGDNTNLIEIALINPDGEIEEFSSKPLTEPDQVHQHLDAHDLIIAIYKAKTHIRRNNYFDENR